MHVCVHIYLYHICAVTKITLCDLHGDTPFLCCVLINYKYSTCFSMCFCVCPLGVYLPWPLSLTNLAEYNYSSVYLSGDGEPAPPPAIKQWESGSTATIGK